jgi:hypothetical protein
MEARMNWTELLEEEAKGPYAAAKGLMELVEDRMLGWKPSTGSNWFTTGQLLLHLTGACGICCRGFTTGEWKDDGVEPGEPGQEGVLPPAERYRSVKSVAEALKLLEEDRRLTFAMIAKAGERDLAEKRLTAPWGGPEMVLGRFFLLGIDHLKAHKAQLFYYLKLQGKSVNTHLFYGM